MASETKFKETEIGMIPDEWEVKGLGEISVNLDNKRVPLSAKEREKMKGIYPYYGAQGIIDHINDYILDGTYLLVAEDGENLKSRKEKIATIVRGKFWVNNHAHIISNNEKSDLKFLYYSINTAMVSKYLTGSVQPKLNQNNLNKILIACPQPQEQKTITNILSSLDDKIDLNNQMNKTLEQIVQTLFKSWFIDFEFPDENGKPYKSSGGRMVDSEFGEIPEGWEVKTISDFCDVRRGASPRPKGDPRYFGGEIPWVKIADATSSGGMFIYRTKETVTEEGKNKSVFLKPGTLILSNSATCGQPYFLEIGGCIHDGWLYFENLNGLTYEYLYFYFKAITEYLVHIADGSVQKNLNTKMIGYQKIAYPNNSLITNYTEVVRPFFDKMRDSTKESIKISQIRDSLLPKLMSGKIRVEC